MGQRIGITSGGNWIVDRVKTLDRLPGRGMLGNIKAEAHSTGGAPANVLVDLARLKAPFPLAGAGVVGRDADGEFVLSMGRRHGIDVSGLVVTDQAPTSYTDVMAEEGTGVRSFFHCRGANALFGPEHVPAPKLTCRIFHLGYLLLLDRMDQPDPQHGTVAAGFLKTLQEQGIKTSVDVVSEESDRFKTLVPPALRYINYLILNEVETARVVNRQVRRSDNSLDGEELRRAVADLYRYGDMEFVAVHMPEGIYLRSRKGGEYSAGSLDVPRSYIKGSLGAGDAFCAGMLYGLHEGWTMERAADLGTCAATACLSHPSATEGVGPADQVLKLPAQYRPSDPPVKV